MCVTFPTTSRNMNLNLIAVNQISFTVIVNREKNKKMEIRIT